MGKLSKNKKSKTKPKKSTSKPVINNDRLDQLPTLETTTVNVANIIDDIEYPRIDKLESLVSDNSKTISLLQDDVETVLFDISKNIDLLNRVQAVVLDQKKHIEALEALVKDKSDLIRLENTLKSEIQTNASAQKVTNHLLQSNIDSIQDDYISDRRAFIGLTAASILLSIIACVIAIS